VRPDFFPKDVAFALAEPWMWEKPLYPEEEQLLSPGAAEKRQREFRAGRHCAHAALQKLGIQNRTVRRGGRGEPLWPAACCGSISHAGERCVAIAAHQRDYLSIAVDIERDRLIKNDTLERISHVQERLQLEQAPAQLSHINLRALLFSVKECIHKVYYPLNQHTLDFHDVEVIFDWAHHTFDVCITRPPANAVCDIRKLSGVFGDEPGYVYSTICLRNAL
jgi:4'-phosphopantetheinyl transferase EntD